MEKKQLKTHIRLWDHVLDYGVQIQSVLEKERLVTGLSGPGSQGRPGML